MRTVARIARMRTVARITGMRKIASLTGKQIARVTRMTKIARVSRMTKMTKVQPVLERHGHSRSPQVRRLPGTGLPVATRLALGFQLSLALTGAVLAVPSTATELSAQEREASADAPSERGAIRGTVIDAATKAPMPGTMIRLVATEHVVVSDASGKFRLNGVPVGGHNLSIERIGYHTAAFPDVMVHPSRTTHVQAELRPRVYEMEGFEVGGGYFRRSEREPVSVVEFSAEEVRRAPGLGIDVSRTLGSLPSMAQLGEGNNDLLVRGGSSMENGFFIDNIPVPNINHFPSEGQTGGPIGMLNVSFIRSVRASVGGFPALHGDRLSSIIDIRYREGNRDEVDGEVQLGLAGVGAGLEGPFAGGRGSWMASVQRSYLDLLVDAIGTGVAPSFSDAQGKVVYDFNPRHAVTLLGIAGGSGISAGPDAGLLHDDHYGDYSARQWTAGLNWSALWADRLHSETSVSTSRVANREAFHRRDDERLLYRSDNADLGFSLRSVTSYSGGRGRRIDVGGEATLTRATYDYLMGEETEGPPERHAEAIEVDDRLEAVRAAGFVNMTLPLLPRLTTTAGVRAEHFSTNGKTVLTPRASASWEVTDRLRLTTAAGLFAQALPLFVVSQDEANRSLPHARARHYVAGAEYLLTPALQVTLEGYRKDYSGFPLNPLHPERFPVDDALSGFGMRHGALVEGGRARSEGIELTAQHKRVERFHALASATYFRSRYRGLDGIWRNRLYDNRVIAQITTGYRVSRTWDISARWLFGGGAPYTPVDVDASLASRSTMFDFSRTNGERLDDYHALNLRVDRRHYFRDSSLVSSLTLTNAYGRENVRMYQWSAARERVEPVKNLGFLPVVGFEYRF